MFNKRVVKAFKKFNKEDILLKIENYLDEHKKRFISELKPFPIKPKRLIGQNGLFFLQNILFRSKALINGWVNLIDSQNVLCVALITRAHYETTGLLALYLKKLKSLYNGNISINDFEESYLKLSLGIKMETSLDNPPEPYSVMKLIDAVDEILKNKNFRESYDFLSEFCHPNHHGIMMGSNILSGPLVKFTDKYEISQKDFCILGYLYLSVILFITLYDEAKDLLEKNEELPV